MNEKKTNKREELEERIAELESEIRDLTNTLKIYDTLMKEKERTIQILTKSLETISGMTETNKMSAVMSLSQMTKEGEKDGVRGTDEVRGQDPKTGKDE